jgi:transposase-like protein
MSEMKPCPRCEADRPVELVVLETSVSMRGKDVSFSSESYRCSVCGEEFDTAETLDRNLERAREEYDRRYRMPTLF